MKKAISILVAAVMLFSTFAVGISAKKSDPSLRFNDDGSSESCKLRISRTTPP